MSSSYRSPGQDTRSSRRSNEEILEEINKLVEEGDAASIPSIKDIVVTTAAHNCDLSVMTDTFHPNRPRSQSQSAMLGLSDSGDDISDEANYLPLQPQSLQRQEQNALFTFQRRHYPSGDSASRTSEDGVLFETTLNAKTSGEDEESMEDIVKRLQQKGASSGVLKFSRTLIQQIRAGEKDVVFVLVQVNGAKFSKDEFGRMMASEVVGLTRERPIIVEIQTEDVVEGETLNVF